MILCLILVMRYEYIVAFLHLFIDQPCPAGSLEFAWYFSVCLIPYLPRERSKIFFQVHHQKNRGHETCSVYVYFQKTEFHLYLCKCG